MKKRKWIKVLMIAVIVLALLGCGIGAVLYFVKNHSGGTVEVYDVSDINAADWISYGDSDGSSGTIVSDVSQSVYVPDDKVVNEVYVEEGDTVKVGDKLVSYDTTLLELDQELQQLTVMELELEIKSAEADLAKLKNTTPVAVSSRSDEGSSSLLDALEYDSYWEDDEARLVSDERNLRMAKEGAEEAAEKEETTGDGNPEVSVEAKTEAKTEENTENGAASEQNTPVENENTTESDTQTETEWILDGENNGISENLTSTDLMGQATGNSGTTEENSEHDGNEQPKLNQSLQPFLTNIRIKEIGSDLTENLLLDTIQFSENSELSVELNGNQIKLIPHFAETEEEQFEKRNTYVMYIKGISLEQDEAGKIYGTANVDGNDYPEIGGFTCVQMTENEQEDVVKLTLAFHDGLDQQHADEAILEDMYLELSLSDEKVTADRLLFVVSEKDEENVEIFCNRPQEEPETETESEQEISEEEIESEAASETESESVSVDETEETEEIQEFYVSVTWNHGTNEQSRWPSEISLLFYEQEEDQEPVFTESVQQLVEEDGDADGETAADSNVQVWDDVSVNWESGRKHPSQYYISTYVPNYIPTITWDGSTAHLKLQMNYLEPEESPLHKLDPISILEFSTGDEAMYYKGSGTEEDPYVFFCTDGAVIQSSFINWVLGFDETGMIRISDGYVIRLEIREADQITGAFIRNIGLDGTIQTEMGFDSTVYWIFSSANGLVKYQEDLSEGTELPDYSGSDLSWDDSGDGYTAEELAYAIAEKERELRQLYSDEKKANLDLKKYDKEMEESVVVSSVNGVVQSLGGSENSDAFMVVASESGMYVKSTVSEMNLEKVEKGQVLTCTSWETGSTFTATITQIDTFPSSTSSDYWSGGNENSSSYPILAVVNEPDIVSEYEYVSVQLPTEVTSGGSEVYLEKAYIRSENGQSYVYIADENGLLKKQYVRTGGNSYGYIEIKEGLTNSDKIAFPYGKNVKPGAKTVDAYGDDY